MISNDYQNLADRIAGYANRLEPIMPSVAKHIAANLLDLADRVRHLEDIPHAAGHARGPAGLPQAPREPRCRVTSPTARRSSAL